MEVAQEAQRGNDGAYLWPARLRLLATAVGVSVPVVAAVVLAWLCTRNRPGDVEVAQQLIKYVTADRPQEAPVLPQDARRGRVLPNRQAAESDNAAVDVPTERGT